MSKQKRKAKNPDMEALEDERMERSLDLHITIRRLKYSGQYRVSTTCGYGAGDSEGGRDPRLQVLDGITYWMKTLEEHFSERERRDRADSDE